MIVRDDRGDVLALDPPPERIVSLVPSISETLWDLGVADRLVGVTRYCTSPDEIAHLPRCGGTKNPDLDRILSLHPDLVLMSEEENRREDFERIAGEGIPVFVSFPRTVEDVAGWVRRVGALVGCGDRAAATAAAIEATLSSLRERVSHVDHRPRLFCPIWKRPWMSFNSDTYAHAVLAVCGAENIFAPEKDRYCEVTLAAVADLAPDLVLLPDEPYPFAEKDIRDLGPVLAPGGTARGARLVDGRALSWYGSRTPQGLEQIHAAIFGGTE